MDLLTACDQIEKEEEEGHSKLTVWEGSNPAIAEEVAGAGGYYGDPETRSFYEDLPDLLSLVPLSVLGLTPEQAAAMKAEWDEKSAKNADSNETQPIVDDKLVEDNTADAAEGGEHPSGSLCRSHRMRAQRQCWKKMKSLTTKLRM